MFTVIRCFVAHLLEFGIVFYLTALVFGFLGLCTIPAVIFAIAAAFLCTVVIAAAFFAVWGITPCEWLLGIKLDSCKCVKTYLFKRLWIGRETPQFVDYKNSVCKNIIGIIILISMVFIYF